ncbi:MAG: UDP-3-O-acyl-N-acetylglucosamine deacetylase [Alphaproteobacteria bacterium]|nr:UDP-3-O-acyl-N-acetylglucosamine deacetylase [Alphaproteobacteria bacterium]
MDGQTTPYLTQRTLNAAIGCVGVGVHTGRRVSLTLRPAEAGTGIVFRRTDLGLDFPARFDRVIDTRLCTVLGVPGQPAARLGTVEHMMAAFAGCGIDNAIAEIDGPELPIVDGSASPLVFLIDCAGVVDQDSPRQEIEILRTVRVTDGEAFAELRPGGPGFRMAMSIDFQAAAIGRQALSLQLTPASFRREIADARTFTDAADIEQLRKAGLAQGGSLANAVVVDAARVLNPGGLRRPDEFVRHKLLDAVGDLALAGAPLRGRFAAHRSGHTLNNRLLRALFADASAWRFAGDVAPALSAAA